MDQKLKLYNIDEQYISYMSMYAPHLFIKTREKNRFMKQGIDFIKIKDYAVINLNNMFPVPKSEYTYVDINKEKDVHYKALLHAEYRVIKKLGKIIIKNAELIYKHKCENGNKTALARRCNDFKILENACKNYI